MIDRRLTISIAAGVAALALAGPAMALDEVTYGTNWLAQAEHGGFYQAVADGTYEKFGLKVTIAQGGPQAANRARLISGEIDFYMGGVLSQFDAAKEGLPTVTVASIFQKDPQIIMAHPDQGIETFADLAKLPSIYISGDGHDSYFTWMKTLNVGFNDGQYKPYTFNPAPFIADPKSAQQGYLTSEPFDIEQKAGWSPKVFLLADEGYAPYSTTIETRTDVLDKNPDLVQRFVDASIIGWYNYLYGDNKAANALIQKDNPEMTDEQIAYGIAKMKEFGVLESGDALEKGIGCMTQERWNAFYDKMVSSGAVDAGIDVGKVFNASFVCKGVGLDVKKALGG